MILIDDRVGSKELLPYMPANISSLDRLDFADVCFTGNGPDGNMVTIGIERKVVSDLVSSITDGRLSGHQLPGLNKHYDYVWLVVEGGMRCGLDGILQHLPYNGKRGWQQLGGFHTVTNSGPKVAYKGRQRPIMWSAVENYLTSIEVVYGGKVRIKRTQGLEDTAQQLTTLYRWWQKAWDDHVSMHQFHRQPITVSLLPNSKVSLLRLMAKELPGIGFEKSKLVLEHFGSVERMAVAAVEEWVKIDGIGKVLAAKCVQALQGG